MADYHFAVAENHTVQMNRTQAGELLSGIDSFEDELRRYYPHATESYAVIEGIISPFRLVNAKMPNSLPTEVSIRITGSPGHMYTYHVTDKGFIHGEHTHKISNKMFKAWLLQLDKKGVTVVNTINYIDTAATIVAFYQNMLKPDHSTLERYIKPKVHLRGLNPHVQALVNLSQAYKLDIGETKATAIIEHFGSLANVLLASVDMLCQVEGIGKRTAEKLVNVIGDLDG